MAARTRAALAGGLGSALLLLAIRSDWWRLRGPAPFPQWEWPFAPRAPEPRHLGALLIGLALVAVASLPGLGPGRRHPRRTALACPAAASGLGCALQIALLGVGEWRPASPLLRKALQPTTISYYNVAVSPAADDPIAFLDRHAQLPPELARSALHASTHPPGAVLYFRGWLGLFRTLPAQVSAALAGLDGGLASQLSYAAPVFLGCGAALALAPLVRSRERLADRLPTLAIALAVCALVLLPPLAAGHEPWVALRTALALHRALVTGARSYLAWLVYDPIDAALFTGPPVVALGPLRLADAVRRRRSGRPLSPAHGRLLALLAVGTLLLASGVVRGEVGRLWMPLMPLALVACTVASADEDDAGRAHPTTGETLCLASLLLAFTTTLRMSWVS